jgi:hypothetical protein
MSLFQAPQIPARQDTAQSSHTTTNNYSLIILLKNQNKIEHVIIFSTAFLPN